MSNAFKIYLDFQLGGGWDEVTDLVQTDLSITQRASSDDFHYAQNVASFKLNYDQTVYNNVIAATNKILAKITASGVDYFTGYIPPTIKRKYNGILDLTHLKLEATDFTDYLDTPIGDVVYANYKVADPVNTSTSIVHTLAGIAGIIVASGVSIDVTLEGFTPSSEDDSVLNVLDTLLYEYGYVLNFNAAGQLEPIQWKTDSVSVHTFDETNIIDTITKEQRSKNDYNAVKVVWYDLETKLNTLIYQESLPYDSFGQFEGYPILAGYDYPPEANVDDPVTLAKQVVYQEYDNKGILYKTNKAITQNLGFNYKAFGSDFTDIVMTSNHVLDALYDTGITVPIETYENKKARIVFRNPTAGALDLYAFNIRADVLYKTSERYSQIQIVASGVNYFTYDSQFIYDSTSADSLAQGIAKNMEVGQTYYDFASEDDIPVGSIVTILTNDNTNQDCFLLERTYDFETEIYSYRAKSFDTDYSVIIRPIVRYRPKAADTITEQQLLDRPTYEQIIASGFDASGGTTTPTTPTLTAQGLFKGIQLIWDKQDNLTNFKEYHLQVSDDEATWYTPKFDRTDWKTGSADSYLVHPTEFIVHTTPLGGTEEIPTNLSLFYRARRVTKTGVSSDWSTTVSGVASSVDTGDLAENSITANKLTVGLLNSLVAQINDNLVVSSDYGWLAGEYASPVSGNERAYLIETALHFQEHNGTDWVDKIFIGKSGSEWLAKIPTRLEVPRIGIATDWDLLVLSAGKLKVRGIVDLTASTTEASYLQIGIGRAGNGFAFIDLVGDPTYFDFGFRMLRHDSGPNAISEFDHRGTGAFVLNAVDLGSIVLKTNNTDRITLTSAGVFTVVNHIDCYITDIKTQIVIGTIGGAEFVIKKPLMVAHESNRVTGIYLQVADGTVWRNVTLPAGGPYGFPLNPGHYKLGHFAQTTGWYSVLYALSAYGTASGSGMF